MREAPALWLVVSGSPWLKKDRRDDRDCNEAELSELFFWRRGKVMVFFFGGSATSPVGAVVIIEGANKAMVSQSTSLSPQATLCAA